MEGSAFGLKVFGPEQEEQEIPEGKSSVSERNGK